MSRTETRHQMLQDRNINGRIRCDLCREPIHGLPQMHELIPRRLTIGNDEARVLSFQPELCAILCADCHRVAEEFAHILWASNYRRHGKENVVSAFEHLWQIWPVNIELPEDRDA